MGEQVTQAAVDHGRSRSECDRLGQGLGGIVAAALRHRAHLVAAVDELVLEGIGQVEDLLKQRAAFAQAAFPPREQEYEQCEGQGPRKQIVHCARPLLPDPV